MSLYQLQLHLWSGKIPHQVFDQEQARKNHQAQNQLNQLK